MNGTVEIGGPEKIPLDAIGRQYLVAKNDKRQVIADAKARYFGTELNDKSLTPAGQHPLVGPTNFKDWLSNSSAQG